MLHIQAQFFAFTPFQSMITLQTDTLDPKKSKAKQILTNKCTHSPPPTQAANAKESNHPTLIKDNFKILKKD